MKYDVTAKMLLESGRQQILEKLLGITTNSVRMIQPLPTETVSLRSTDFPMLVRILGKSYILLLEIQTWWDEDKVLGIAEYRIRYKRKYPKWEVVPYMILLTKNDNAQDHYKDDYLETRFHLIKIWELDSADYLEAGLEVQPFIPLMKGGLDHVLDAERKIYNKDITQAEKGDLLTALMIFTGLRDKGLMRELLNRRRDIMIESPAYDLIMEEGMEKGMEKGMVKGRLEAAHRMKAKGFDLETIMDLTGLTREQLQEDGITE